MAKNKKKEDYGRAEMADAVLESKPAAIIVGVICILFSIFFALIPLNDKPIAYNEAEYYTGIFERADEWKNGFDIYTSNGETYSLHHAINAEQRESINKIAKGTQLYIRVNPNSGYIVELRAGAEKIIDFDEMQAAIASYDKGYLFIGAIPFLGGIFLILYPFIFASGKAKEAQRQRERDKKRKNGADSAVLHKADMSAKSRVFLTASVKGLDICYRRIGITNELVINGDVYDTVKGVLEFDHKLIAVIKGDTVEAGLKGENCYIKFCGKKIASRERKV